MRYLSLFSGIGGFELGIQQSYEKENNNLGRITETPDTENRWDKSNTNRGNGERWGTSSCVGYSEINKYAIQIYEKHFKHKNYGDITKINPKELPDFDLIVGGFPCQSFSIAGKRLGFDDTRGTLFFDIARIVKEKRPKYLLLENVKGLLSHDNGNTFRTILSTINELGYDFQWQVLNSKNFGVPQNRERVFIVGHLRGEPRPEVFPIGEGNEISSIQQPREKDKESKTASALTATYYKGGKGSQVIEKISGTQAQRVYDTEGIAPTIKALGGGQGAKTGLYFIRNPYNGKTSETETGTIGTSVGTSTGKTAQHLYKDSRIRRLTPTECERLQGFPDCWTEGVSDTQRYKCLGNAVTVNVIREIMKRI